MRKIIKILTTTVLLLILVIVVIAVFNPYNLRNKIISSALNYYLSSQVDNYEPLKEKATDSFNEVNEKTGEYVNNAVETVVEKKNNLLNEAQEKTLEDLGVDVSKLPSEISPEMQACFVEKLGQERSDAIVKGDSPTAMEVFKARICLTK